MKHQIIIIGAGPAGSNCAIWLKQLGFDVLLADREAMAGGLQLKNPYTNSWVATSPGATGQSIVRALNESLKSHEVQTLYGFNVESIERLEAGDFCVAGVVDSEKQQRTSSIVVLASGVSPRGLGLIDLAKRAKLIIGASSVFDNKSIVNGSKVAVLGGGDSAFETAKKLNIAGAKEVYVFARSIKARPALIEQAGPINVILDPSYYTDGESVCWAGKSVEFDHIAVMYGFKAELEYAKGLGLAFDTKGFIQTDSSCKTNVDGVYAIGEIANRSHPCCITAMADGVVAAKSIQRQLEQNSSATLAAIKRASSLFKAIVHA